MTQEDSPGTSINNELASVEGGGDSSQDGNTLSEKELENDPDKKIEYPRSVLFIVCNEFCERFSYYGLRTVLSLYLTFKLHYDHDLATVIYHVFIMLCYFFPFLGAILADSYLGKFKTIFYLSTVYALGNIVVSAAAIPNTIPPREFTIFGLILIALGTGGIKPCVSAFGGDQFVLPQQEDQLQKFFSLFYFAINAGSLLSTFLTPILREDVKCFGEDSCYSLAFGVPAILMIAALIIFMIGKKWYKMKEPEGNIIVQVSKCIWYAARKKSTNKGEHWLYKAEDKYDRKFIEDIIATLRVLVLFIPLPIFWALFDQQGSRWTFQATRMKDEIGWGIKLKPDQMQVVNPALILIFIPIFESIIYPTLAKCNLLKRPLQRLTVGGLLAAAAFGISALVEIELEKTYPVLPVAGEGQLRLINTFPENMTFDLTLPQETKPHSVTVDPEKIYSYLNITVDKSADVQLKNVKTGETAHVKIFEKTATFYVIGHKSFAIAEEDVDRSRNGEPRLMIILPGESENYLNLTLSSTYKNFSFDFNTGERFRNLIKLPSDLYTIHANDKVVGEIELKLGGIYSLTIERANDEYRHSLLTITEPNSVPILWLLPQYIVMTAGEVMFSVTGLEFSFTQAPASMKSVMQAIWLFTVAVGNMVVVIVAEAKIFESQTYEFLLFGGLMLLDMIIFALMAMKYTYVEDIKKDNKIEMNGKK